MSKIIIHNNSGLSDALAVDCVKKVMEMGFVSGESQYCWVSRFENIIGNNFLVVARKTNGKTHSFNVENSK